MNNQPEQRADEPTATASETDDAQRTVSPAEQDAYDELRQDQRVVMRHNIALNLDSFKASTEDFAPRPVRDYPPLSEIAPPFFSVIIPNYNGRRFLEPLFAGLMAQTLRDFEVIFADDASTDDSVTFVEEESANQPVEQCVDIRVLVNRRNRGFVATCNAAAAAARGHILVFLNNDTEPEPGWLAALARTICANPQAAIVSSKVLLFDQRTTLHTAGDLLGRDGVPRNRGVWQEDSGQFDGQTTIFSGSGCGTAYRHDVWEALGGFDADYWMYLEDVDFAFRAQLLGWVAVFAPEARVYHRLSATSGHTLASYYVGRNTIWTVAKNMPRRLLLRHLPAIVGAQLAIAWDALRNIRGEAARARLRGQLAGVWRVLPQLRKRQVIQQRRIVDDAVLGAKLVD